MSRLAILLTIIWICNAQESPTKFIKTGLERVTNIVSSVKPLAKVIPGSDLIVNNKYFDDILKIWNHVDFERISGRSLVQRGQVTYYLFTRENKENYTFITPSNFQPLNNGKEINFMIHGWTESREKEWYENLKNALLDSKDVNVIQVDWSEPANDLYPVSVMNTRDVGDIIGDFIVKINETLKIALENFTVIGHSLGGQVAGYVGKRVDELSGTKIYKIVALDPAGPLFSDAVSGGDRLNATDAEIVEVIHTDGGKFGFAKPCGTIDFFPNDGSAPQPGCLSMDNINISNINGALFCSHHRSYRFYIEAVRREGFEGVKCDSWKTYTTGVCDNNEKARFYSDNHETKDGNFYLKTNADPPYSQ